MFTDLYPVLQDIICGFAFQAKAVETMEALETCLFIKSLGLHPFVLSPSVYDYTGSHKTVYSRSLRVRLTERYIYWNNGRVRSPLDEFFVWFCSEELFDQERIARILAELDWRTIRPLIKDCQFRSRDAFFMWVVESLVGILRCSELFDQIRLSNLKMYPSNETRFMVHRVNCVL